MLTPIPTFRHEKIVLGLRTHQQFSTPATTTIAVLATVRAHVDDALLWQHVAADAHEVVAVLSAVSAQILPFFCDLKIA